LPAAIWAGNLIRVGPGNILAGNCCGWLVVLLKFLCAILST